MIKNGRAFNFSKPRPQMRRRLELKIKPRPFQSIKKSQLISHFQILTWLDSEGLGQKSLEEKEYASECWNLSPAKIWSHVDFFAFAHFTGWIMKTLLLRHWVLCWFLSIIWEFTEVYATLSKKIRKIRKKIAKNFFYRNFF